MAVDCGATGVKLYVPQISYRTRWLTVAAWGVCMVFYLSWIFEPVVSRYTDWWYPSVYLRLVAYMFFGGFKPLFRGEGLYGVLGFDPTSPWRWSGIADYSYNLYLLGWFSVFVLSALLFLPRRSERQSMLPAKRRPTISSVIAAAFGASVLTMGFGALVLGLASQWDSLIVWINTTLSSKLAAARLPGFAGALSVLVGFAVVLLMTVMWTFVLHGLWRRRERYWQYERMTLWLMVGAVMLLIVAGISHGAASYLDHEDGAYTGLALGWTVLFWAWGCRIRLLFLLPRFEQSPADTLCMACGYDLRGTMAAGRSECPECGARIVLGA